MGLHLTISVDVYLGIMLYASFCTHTDKRQVPDVLPKGLGFYCHKGQQAQVWAATPTAQVPKLGLNVKRTFITWLGVAQWPCKRRRRHRIAAGQRDGNDNDNSNAYISQRYQAVRALHCSMVTVTFVTWFKVLPSAWLLTSIGISTSCELRHRPLCLARTLCLLHIACLLDSCCLH